MMMRNQSQPPKAAFLQSLMWLVPANDVPAIGSIEDNYGFQDCYRKVLSTVKIKTAGAHLPSAWVTLTPNKLWHSEWELTSCHAPRTSFSTRWEVGAGISQQWAPGMAGARRWRRELGSRPGKGSACGMITLRPRILREIQWWGVRLGWWEKC